MATITISLLSICDGGEHAKIRVTMPGGATRDVEISASDVLTPLSADEQAAAVAAMIRLHCNGMTRAQTRNAIQSGINVATS
jgi:hypothetical protein